MSNKTASQIRPGDFAEFPLIRVVDAYKLESGKHEGMIRIEYAKPYDGSGNTFRIYSAQHVF